MPAPPHDDAARVAPPRRRAPLLVALAACVVAGCPSPANPPDARVVGDGAPEPDAADSALCLAVDPPAPEPALEPRATSERLNQRRYVAAGDRAYVVGTADGRFPPMGWHIPNEMGGVWAHPIKLLDGYWFAIDDAWLTAATRFTAAPGLVEFAYAPVNGVEVTRTEFAPDGQPAVLVALALRNTGAAPRTVALAMEVRSELMAVYPWSLASRQANGHDEGAFDPTSGTLRFREPGRPWAALVGASVPPAAGAVGDEFWGAVAAANRPAYTQFGNGTGGRLRWDLALDPGASRTVWIAVAGSHRDEATADAALRAVLADPVALQGARVAARALVTARSRVSLPDPALVAAYEWSKQNTADLVRAVTDVQVRDTRQGTVFPATPAATIAQATGLGAGFPDYAWFFGVDGEYTVFPLLASGQWETAMGHLRLLRDVSRAVNGETGKVVHEVATDGSVYFGTNAQPGNTNETVLFALAVEQVWRWTGDDAFRDEMYDFVRAGLRYVTSAALDQNQNGCPEGAGAVERAGAAAEKLDVAVYTWEALGALARMARARGDAETGGWAEARAAALRATFDVAWWMPDASLYADSTADCGSSAAAVQQGNWICATPMEALLAPSDRANAALDVLESPDYSSDTGLYHTAGAEPRIWTLPSGVMAVAEANYGRLGETQALRYMRGIAAQLDVEMPGALPEMEASPDYDPFGPLGSRAMFLQAWSAYGAQWPVVRGVLGIRPDAPARRVEVVPQLPEGWPSVAIDNVRMRDGSLRVSARRDAGGVYATRVDAPAGWTVALGVTLPPGAQVASVSLDCEPARFAAETTSRGLEVRVEAAGGAAHTIVVLAR